MIGFKGLAWIAGIAGVVVVGQGVGLVMQHGRINTLTAQVQAADAKVEAADTKRIAAESVCQVTVEGNTDTITALRDANRECAKSKDQIAASGAAAVDEANRDRKQGWARYYQAQQEIEALYEQDQDCSAWADAWLCAAVAERLRLERTADPAPAH